ncbi:Hint domain-containing protein [Shimia thalassica]|nr:Hint domain-containing protein [Shimia thalassica]
MTFEGIENIVACFTTGTLLTTPRGSVPIEDMTVGNRVLTRDHGFQRIRWIGHRDVGPGEFETHAHWQPVCIQQGALGEGLPNRDTLFSPNHRVLLCGAQAMLYFGEGEVLVPAKHLIGMQGVTAAEVEEITYWHILFDCHELVLSNNAWTESFQPGSYVMNALEEEQRREIFELFPELEGADAKDLFRSSRRTLTRTEAMVFHTQ